MTSSPSLPVPFQNTIMMSGGFTPLSNASPPGNTRPTTNPHIVICVFCGASPGKSPAHMAAARDLARVFHTNGIRLCFGGGTDGLMGEVARSLVALSGPDAVHGIIPEPLVRYEQGDVGGLPSVSEYGHTTVVRDMHTRKQMMVREVLAGAPGSGFVALPGGYGTLEELMEVVTWNQLGIHGRGIVAFNVEGYWDGLFSWVRGSVEAGFVREGSRNIIVEAKTGEEAVRALREYKVAEGRFKLHWEGQEPGGIL